LIEWRFRPQFGRKRRAQERWENELQELLELLEIRLPLLTRELNHFRGMAKHHADFEEVEDLHPQQRDVLDRFAESWDADSSDRASTTSPPSMSPPGLAMLETGVKPRR
jgi:hypothetical protein